MSTVFFANVKFRPSTSDDSANGRGGFRQLERDIGANAFRPRWQPTLPFQRYAAQVASLYNGMDLRKFF